MFVTLQKNIKLGKLFIFNYLRHLKIISFFLNHNVGKNPTKTFLNKNKISFCLKYGALKY